jgi:phosphoserine phosphatase RsbU/P
MIEQKVRSILRHQEGILETEKCGVVIANFRKDDDLMVYPFSTPTNKPLA